MATIDALRKLRRRLAPHIYEYTKELDAIQQEVDEEFVRLPLDANGEVIRVGDELTYCGNDPSRVIVLMLHNDPERRDGQHHWSIQREADVVPLSDNRLFRHCHKPAVEDVLREFAAIYLNTYGNFTDDKMFAEYAEKIRLVSDGNEEHE